MRLLIIVLSLLLAVPAAVGPAQAVLPDEILADPVLEARARAISDELRCLVCRSESIDESNADLARDLRILLRERLVAGDTDAEVKDFMVARFGEFVLLKPRFSLGNALIWLSGPIVFLIGLLAVIAYMRARRRASAAIEAPLSDSERKRLEEILNG